MADTAANSDSRPEGKSVGEWANFWNKELHGSSTNLRKWKKQAGKTVKRYVDDRAEGEDTWFRLNLFHANVTTLMSMLYGQLPKVEVQRRFGDPDDDVARVAALILERLLNNDVQENGEEYNVLLRGVLEDRLVPGLGCAVVRYEMDTKKKDKEFVDTTTDADDDDDDDEEENEVLDWEDAPCYYHYWGDVLWSWARNWSELRWLAFRHYLTKEAATARFGATKADQLHYTKNNPASMKDEPYDRDAQDSVVKAEVWEIWDKEEGEVFWHQRDQELILDKKEDPLELEGFFPCPPFFIANTSTTYYRPVSDFFMAQDLYNEIDRLETRIAMITEAVKVIGVYDKQQEGIQRMFKEGIENDLIPVDNWALFAEKGGIGGVIDWFPVADVVATLDRLVDQRNDAIQLLYQVTGMSDIMRGAASQTRVSATEQELKAKFGSVRVQALQDEFARFASDLLQIKAEIICKHFSPETIVMQANVKSMNEADQALAPEALRLIKTPQDMYYRIVIRPESVAMVDYAQKQQERTSYIQSLGFFLQSATPLIEKSPEAAAPLMEMLQWGMAGFKGSDEIEGVLDAAIEKMSNAKPQEDPGAAADKAKADAEQAKQQAKMQEMQMKQQHDQQKHQFEMREMTTRHQFEMKEMVAEFNTKMQVIQAQMTGKVVEQAAQTHGHITEQTHSTDAKIREQDNAVSAKS